VSDIWDAILSLLLFLSGQFRWIELPDRQKFCNVYLLHHKGRYLPCRPFFVGRSKTSINSRAALQPALPQLDLKQLITGYFLDKIYSEGLKEAIDAMKPRINQPACDNIWHPIMVL